MPHWDRRIYDFFAYVAIQRAQKQRKGALGRDYPISLSSSFIQEDGHFEKEKTSHRRKDKKTVTKTDYCDGCNINLNPDYQ
jgi:hypothetical protein